MVITLLDEEQMQAEFASDFAHPVSFGGFYCLSAHCFGLQLRSYDPVLKLPLPL